MYTERSSRRNRHPESRRERSLPRGRRDDYRRDDRRREYGRSYSQSRIRDRSLPRDQEEDISSSEEDSETESQYNSEQEIPTRKPGRWEKRFKRVEKIAGVLASGSGVVSTFGDANPLPEKFFKGFGIAAKLGHEGFKKVNEKSFRRKQREREQREQREWQREQTRNTVYQNHRYQQDPRYNNSHQPEQPLHNPNHQDPYGGNTGENQEQYINNQTIPRYTGPGYYPLGFIDDGILRHRGYYGGPRPRNTY